MRNVVIIALIAAAAPQLAAAGDVRATAIPVDHFRAITPRIVVKRDELFVEGGYCRNARYAARPEIVRIVKIDAAGREIASETARVRGATGNRSQGCGFYSALTGWSLAAGETIKVTPVL